jgi:hypothetical protein
MSAFAQALQTMALLPFLIFILALAGIAVYFFYLIWRNLNCARAIDDTPTARVRSAPQGYVELQGEARCLPDKPVLAPLTNTICVWYRFKIEREKHNSRSGSHWSEVESGRSGTPFVLFDVTGECLVDPRHAEVTPVIRKVWYGSSKWPGALERRGLFGALLGTRYRYTEERIDAGDVYVLGWFDTLRSTDQSVSEELGMLLKKWKQDQPGLLRRFDTNGDGRIDANEWQNARQMAHCAVLEDRAGRSARPAINIVRASEHDGQPFLISARPQWLLSDRYRRHALLALIGSVSAAGLLAWMVVVRF